MNFFDMRMKLGCFQAEMPMIAANIPKHFPSAVLDQ
jgi:hypothetical protein